MNATTCQAVTIHNCATMGVIARGTWTKAKAEACVSLLEGLLPVESILLFRVFPRS